MATRPNHGSLNGNLSNGLPVLNRYITSHDDTGKAVFYSTIPEQLPFQEIPDGAQFCLGYATNTVPVDMNQSRDINAYERYLENKPGVMIPGGTVCRIVDMLPGALSPMHRTISLDFGTVLEGEVELVLDSGERRLMRRGDVAVQRGTNHAWKNVTPDGGHARMMYVLQEALPVNLHGLGGKELDEDYGGIPGVRPSRGSDS